MSHAEQLELLSYAPGAKPPDAPKRKKRAKKAEKPGTRQDPLKSGEMPVFGPKQLGPGAIVANDLHTLHRIVDERIWGAVNVVRAAAPKMTGGSITPKAFPYLFEQVEASGSWEQGRLEITSFHPIGTRFGTSELKVWLPPA